MRYSAQQKRLPGLQRARDAQECATVVKAQIRQVIREISEVVTDTQLEMLSLIHI